MVKNSTKVRVDQDEKVENLSPELAEALLRFMEYHPATRIGRNLRKMLLEFLQYDGAIEASYLDDLLFDLEGLYELLDRIEKENKSELDGRQ